MQEFSGGSGFPGPSPPPPGPFSPPAPPPIAPGGGTTPWIGIWRRPRATIRHILDTDPRRSVLLLAALGGVAGGMALAAAPVFGFGDRFAFTPLLLGAVLGGALSGIVGLYIGGWLIALTGRWIGGGGSAAAVRPALAWSAVPLVWGLLLWLPRVALLGGEAFLAHPAGLEDNPLGALLMFVIGLLNAVIGVWAIVVRLKCIGEAHRFSAWRALCAAILAGIVLAVPMSILVLIAKAI